VRLLDRHGGGFVAAGPSVGPSEVLFGVKETRPAPDSDSNTQNWADRGIIPDEISLTEAPLVSYGQEVVNFPYKP
jgi:hypothetical protein